MSLTTEQRNAVRTNENVLIDACPGSGKTRVIISKLIRTVDEVRDTPRKVACITYTNTAVYEIEARLRINAQPGDEDYYDVCTIHSFCLNHIFRPFCHLIKGYEEGFKVLTPESEEYIRFVGSAYENFGRPKPSHQEIEGFSYLNITPTGEPIGSSIDRGMITPEMVKFYWASICGAGFVDFANILYHSLWLLKKRREILEYVASRFAWILIDEFQDTSDLQVEIMSLIAQLQRTQFFLVGDPLQSIFRFAGARPDLAEEFADQIGAKTDLPLSGNFRSSQLIVDQAEAIFSRTPPMIALGAEKDYSHPPQWRHGASSFEVIVDHYLPTIEALNISYGNTAILAPTWFTLFPLGKKLREYGLSIIGPGARPYRRSRQFAPLAEQICGFLMDGNPDLIVYIERTLFNTLLNITGRANFSIFSYQGRVVVFRLLEKGRELHQEHMGAIDWLRSAAIGVTQVLISEEYLTETERNLFANSVEEMIADMRRDKVDVDNLAVSDLGLYARTNTSLKLSTLHNAKGREFDAVALIDVHEGSLPSYHARTDEDIAEARRLFYVGVTRAKKYLLYVTDNTGRRGASRFLKELGQSLI